MGFEPDGHSRDYRPRRQELTQSGWETGACYAVRVSALLEFKVRYPFPTGVIDTHFYEAIDIDSWDDLIAARALANLVDLGHIQE
jgi:CMP-N-acetylneuraminic acid synthetase